MDQHLGNIPDREDKVVLYVFRTAKVIGVPDFLLVEVTEES